MAFKIAQKNSYKVTVKVKTPNDNDGFDTSEFKVEFKRVNMAELDRLRDKENPVSNREALEGLIVGFAGLLDENDKEMDFNETNLRALLDVPQAVHALTQAFWTSIFHVKEKN